MGTVSLFIYTGLRSTSFICNFLFQGIELLKEFSEILISISPVFPQWPIDEYASFISFGFIAEGDQNAIEEDRFERNEFSPYEPNSTYKSGILTGLAPSIEEEHQP